MKEETLALGGKGRSAHASFSSRTPCRCRSESGVIASQSRVRCVDGFACDAILYKSFLWSMSFLRMAWVDG